MAIILTTPISSPNIITDTIPANSVRVIDAVNALYFPNTTWQVQMYDDHDLTSITQIVTMSYSQLTNTVRYSRHSITGDLIPHNVQVVLSSDGLTCQLIVTNTSDHNYIVEIKKI